MDMRRQARGAARPTSTRHPTTRNRGGGKGDLEFEETVDEGSIREALSVRYGFLLGGGEEGRRDRAGEDDCSS